MAKVWFNKLDFYIEANIQYTNKGKPIKPYLSSFFVILNVEYNGKNKGIEIVVFPRSGKIEVEYRSDGKSVVAKAPIEYKGIPNYSSIETSFDNIEIPNYMKRVLKTITDNTFSYNDLLNSLSSIKEIQDLSNTPVGKLPKLTQTVKMGGIIFDKNDYDEDLGEVYIDEYINIDDTTEYKVSHNWFTVQANNGELTAIEKTAGKEEMGFDKEEFNPFDQEILETIIPTQKEFENLVQFVMNLIRKGEIEFGEKNIIDLG